MTTVDDLRRKIEGKAYPLDNETCRLLLDVAEKARVLIDGGPPGGDTGYWDLYDAVATFERWGSSPNSQSLAPLPSHLALEGDA